LRLEVASVSPRAPDRSESTFWGFGHLEPLFQHEAAVRKQRLEIVSVMHGNERAKGVEAFAGLQRLLMSILHTDLSLTCVEHRNWKGNQMRSRFGVPYSDTRVSAPHVNNRRAASIVARVHAEIVLLGESCVQWDYPVRTTLVRAALKRPERHIRRAALRVDRIVVVGPLQNLQL